MALSASALRLWESQSGARTLQCGTPQGNQASDLSGAIGVLLTITPASESYEGD